MTAIITKPGVYELPEDDYHADPVPDGSLSCSWAKQIARPGGPAKWRWEHDHPRPPRKEFDLGHAAHQLVLGVGAPIARIPYAEWRSNAAKAAVAEARDAGAIPLKPAEYEQVTLMAAQIEQHRLASSLLAEALRHEASAFLPDERTGTWLRCRFDSIGDRGTVDYKTTISADPTEFVRQAMRLGYHQQAAWYRDMAMALDLTDGPFRFIAQEKTAPYLVAVIELDADAEDLGRTLNQRAIDTFATCVATDTWPGYPEIIHRVSAPAWAYQTEELDTDTEQELLALLKGNAS